MHMVIHLFHIVAVQKKFNIYNHRTDKVDTWINQKKISYNNYPSIIVLICRHPVVWDLPLACGWHGSSLAPTASGRIATLGEVLRALEGLDTILDR
jgi:hypothetical protein